MTIVGFTGTRVGLTLPQRRSLHCALEDLDCEEIHHGDCIGADAEADTIAAMYGWTRGSLDGPTIQLVRRVLHPPEDSTLRAYCPAYYIHEPAPFLNRNRDIVRASHVLIACPWQEHGEEQRSGTWSTVRFARLGGSPVAIIRPSGAIAVENWPTDGRWRALPPVGLPRPPVPLA